MITGDVRIALARIITLKYGLVLEMKGMRRSGRQCSTILRALGFRGTLANGKLFEHVKSYLEQIENEKTCSFCSKDIDLHTAHVGVIQCPKEDSSEAPHASAS